MKLTDYETPDPYAPDPRASQKLSARKRQRTIDKRRTTEDERLKTPTRRQLLAVGMALLILAFVGAASYQLARLPSARPLAITPVPTIVATDAMGGILSVPTIAPTATPVLPKIDAYAAPDGALLGQIEADRQITPVAHYGAGWIQAEVAGSGLVWLRVSDAPYLAIVGPDLAPVAQQPAPQTGQGLTFSQTNEWTPPESTPPPPAEPTSAPDWPTSAPAKVTDFEKPSITDRCKMIGCLGQQAVDLARAQTCHALFWQYGDADSETISEPDYSAVRGCIWEGLYK